MILKHINMDKGLLRQGGRKAVRISEHELVKKLYDVHLKTKYIDVGDDFDAESINFDCVVNLPNVKKDLEKVNFDFENSYCTKLDTPVIDESVPNLLGINTIKDGIPFLGCMAGGDWEYPLFFIIYWDGEDFRGYIPSYGNVINLDFKCAFGSEGDSLIVDTEEVLKRTKYVGCDIEYASTVYLKEQGLDDRKDVIVVNWDAVREDIESRIEL